MNVSALKKPNQCIERVVKKLSFRLGQLLPCLTSPAVCTSWRLLFTYRQHTPTVTGQHPRVARHSPMKHLGSKWHQWKLYISGTTQMRRSIQLQLPQESRNYCSKFFKQLTHFLPYRALSLLKTLPPSTLDSPDVTKKILGDRPNTYTFTKVKRPSDTMVHFHDLFSEGNGRAACARRRSWIAHLYRQTKHRCLDVEGTVWIRETRTKE